MNTVWNTDEGDTESIILFIFLLSDLIVWGWEVMDWDKEQPAEIESCLLLPLKIPEHQGSIWPSSFYGCIVDQEKKQGMWVQDFFLLL